MPPAKDMTGETFGRLTVAGDTGRRRHGQVVWRCRCACGQEVEALGANLRKGRHLSCGCWRREEAAQRGHEQLGRSDAAPPGVRVDLTAEEKERLWAACRREGCSMGELIRRALRDAGLI